MRMLLLRGWLLLLSERMSVRLLHEMHSENVPSPGQQGHAFPAHVRRVWEGAR